MRWVSGFVALATTMLVAGDAPASTFFFFAAPTPQLFTSAEAAITARSAAEDGVVVQLDTSDGTRWELSFFPPAGDLLVPGSYTATGPAAGDGRARLGVVRQGEDCIDSTGTFVVHDATFGPLGDVIAFAADFTWRCEQSGRSLAGAVRVATGDAACTPGSDGIACDDLNPCTSADACHGGACTGTDTVTPTCGGTATCPQAATCSPITGACTSPGETCPPSCTSEPCEPVGCSATSCDDGDACTVDRCDATRGCVAERIPGCWNITGGGVLSVSATGSGFGRTATCTVRCQTLTSGTLLLDRGTYRAPAAGPGFCPSGLTFDAPDEVGDVVRRHGRLVLKARNRADLLNALRRCTGDPFTLRRYRTAVRLDTARGRMTGTNEIRLVIPGRFRTTVKMVVRFTGALAGAPAPLDVPNHALPVCAPDLEPVCVVVR